MGGLFFFYALSSFPMRFYQSIFTTVFSLLSISLPSNAQTSEYAKYDSPNNPLYWKNKKPYEGYWQQDVHYVIKAQLNDSSECIHGNEILTYSNNSPFAIAEAYFHLYQNAVQPGSLTDELYRVNKLNVKYGRYENAKLGTTIESFKVNDTPISFEIFNTILKVKLHHPLQPGQQISFQIKFTTYFDRGSIRRRMKVYDHHGIKHFNGVHWYPRIAVFDKKFTWETAQHLEREFYGDFGCFEIELNLPDHYVVEATGELINKNIALPKELRDKLDIANFKDKPLGSQPSIIIPPTGNRKNWLFRAINVHDFAWTADPTYRIGETTWNGIQCIAIAQENNASGWQQTAQYTARVIATYSRDFGMYEYPKIVCADAADGMEYPMITLDGGTYPGHQSLIAHEVGHNWFFGMIGSNETYRAALDEGFTQFLTAWCMRKLTKENQPELRRAFSGYMEDAIDGKDEILETHSDGFQSATGQGGGYKHVYYKTASMLYDLQYVLGDSIFLASMRHYVKQWKICHPYIDDFRNSITESAQTDLTTFFDQWFNTTKVADYGIKKITSLNPSKGLYRVTIIRKGEMLNPVDLDFLVEPPSYTSNTTENIPKLVQYPITIPVSFYEKPGRINVKPWLGWDKLRKTYTMDIEMPYAGKIKQVWLDRSGRMPDIYRVDNVWKHRMQWALDLGNGKNTSYLGVYQLMARPGLRYNGTHGLMLGGLMSGQYAGRKKQFELGVWYASTQGNWSNPFSKFNQLKPWEKATKKLHYRFGFEHSSRGGGDYHLNSLFYNGVALNEMGWKSKAGNTEYGINAKYMKRGKNLISITGIPFVPSYTDDPYQPQTNTMQGYIPSPTRWGSGSNVSLNLFVKHKYAAFGRSGTLQFDTRLPSPWSQSQFGFVKFQWNHFQPIVSTTLKIRTFIFAGSGKLPNPESALYLSAANPEESFNLPMSRDLAMVDFSNQTTPIDPSFGGSNQAQYLWVNGGLNLRGYSYYSAPHHVKQANGQDTVLAFFRGNQGASINGMWDITSLFKWVPKLKLLAVSPYFFGDAGIIGQPLRSLNKNAELITKQVYSGLMADAGFGASINIKNLSHLFLNRALKGSRPITFRCDFPLWLSAVQSNDSNLKFRMRFSIGTEF